MGRMSVIIPAIIIMMATGILGLDVLKIDILKNRYEGVEFTHGAHVEYVDDCSRCHHFSEEPVKCTTCHEIINLYTYKGSKRSAGIGLKGAYHGLCLGCHREIGGPVGCEDCHVRKKVTQTK